MEESCVRKLRDTLELHMVKGVNILHVSEDDIQCLLDVAVTANDDAIRIVTEIARSKWSKTEPNIRIVNSDLEDTNIEVFKMSLDNCYITETLLISKTDIEQYIVRKLLEVNRTGYHFLDKGDYVKITNDYLKEQTWRVMDYVFETVRQFLENLNIRNIHRENNDAWDIIITRSMMRQMRVKLRQDADLDWNRITGFSEPISFFNCISYHFWDNVEKDEDATFFTYKQCDENTLGIRLYLNTNHLIKEIEKGRESLSKPDEYLLVYETVDDKERMRTRYYKLTDDELRDYLKDFLNKRFSDAGHAYIANYEIARSDEISRGEIIRLLVLLEN